MKPSEKLIQDKMKTEGTTWSNNDDVLATFNSLSFISCSQNSTESKIPKHRISNAQFKMVNCNQNRSLSDRNSYTPSFGRGKFITNLKDKLPPRFHSRQTEQDIKAKDTALSEHIRSVTDIDFGNSAIEAYYNNICNGDFDEAESSGCNNVGKKSGDEPCVSSELRVDAADFYPPGFAKIAPEKVAISLDKLRKDKEITPETRLAQRPSESNKDKDLIGFKTNESCEHSAPSESLYYSKRKNPSYLDSITVSGSSLSPSFLGACGSSVSLLEQFKPIKEKLSAHEQSDKKSEPRSKRLVKNALLLGLQNKKNVEKDKSNHLMKPSDFQLSSESSEFLPDEPESTTESLYCRPYDFLSDPTVDEDTKSLVASIISDDLSSETLSTASSSEHSKKSKQNLTSFRPYNYQFREEDFPALS